MRTPKKLIAACIKDINEFYECSFHMPPDQTLSFVITVFKRLEELSAYLAPAEFQAFQNYLRKSLEYMEQHDYVLMRDCLHYEVRNWLENL